ncbi:MAG: HNH endonuclease signature motif containing protein [Chloroflexota bacterium]
MSTAYIPAELRRFVATRAKQRCEYCLMAESESFAPMEVDHIVAQKHGGATVASNLAYCCPLCNKHKGSDVASYDPETGALTPLFHPRHDHWQEHFQVYRDGQIWPQTAVGRVTVTILQLNRPERVKERQLLLAYNLWQLPE